jgi:archaellum component FlaC
MNYKLSTEFDKINERMRKIPKNIEEVTETKKYISEIPIQVEKLKNEIQDCTYIYEVLEEYGYDQFSSSDID